MPLRVDLTDAEAEFLRDALEDWEEGGNEALNEICTDGTLDMEQLTWAATTMNKHLQMCKILKGKLESETAR